MPDSLLGDCQEPVAGVHAPSASDTGRVEDSATVSLDVVVGSHPMAGAPEPIV